MVTWFHPFSDQDLLNEETRDGSGQRRDKRCSIPFSVAPRGEVRGVDGSRWPCTLWDLSRHGLCVVARGCVELPIGSELRLGLFEVMGQGSVSFQTNLRWFANDAFQTFLGLQFNEPKTLPQDSFLERYLQTMFDV
jgi:c-di-GMP-binding flagellar brake protein YcgR